MSSATTTSSSASRMNLSSRVMVRALGWQFAVRKMLGAGGRSGLFLLDDRQGEIKRGALVDDAFGPCAAAVPLDDAADVGQADARALELARGVQPLEYAEQLGGVLHVEACAVVADGDDVLLVG